jgi:prephenate dehydratase
MAFLVFRRQFSVMRIAYQGEPGAYSEAAALRFSPHAQTLPCESFDQVFAAVESGKATHGILPIENSIGGSIHRNYDLLLENELPVVAEVLLQVSHNLLAYPGTRRQDLKKVYSHPQGLAQCENFLSGLKGVEIVATYDTAGSAKMIRDKEIRDAAAIASARAAEVFGLSILESGIQDFKENITRFIVISKTPPDLEKADKTMIVFTLPNTPGALFKALSVFALRGIDLTKLESRPVRGRAFEYLFYADIAVPRQDVQCTRALVHLAEFARTMRTLGSYASWKEPAQQAQDAGLKAQGKHQ